MCYFCSCFQLAELLYIAQDGLELSVSSPQLPWNGACSCVSPYLLTFWLPFLSGIPWIVGPDPFPDCVLLPCPEVEERKYLEADCVVLLSLYVSSSLKRPLLCSPFLIVVEPLLSCTCPSHTPNFHSILVTMYKYFISQKFYKIWQGERVFLSWSFPNELTKFKGIRILVTGFPLFLIIHCKPKNDT